MPIGLLLIRRDAVEVDGEREAELVAYANSLEEIVGWYKHHNTSGAVDSPLKDYIPLEEAIFDIMDGAVGFIQLASLEEVMQNAEEMVEAARLQAREMVDEYREKVEPKVVHFDVNSPTGNTIQ